jgi:hypothetical protein
MPTIYTLLILSYLCLLSFGHKEKLKQYHTKYANATKCRFDSKCKQYFKSSFRLASKPDELTSLWALKPIENFITFYKSSLTSNVLVTKSITSTIGFAIGDLVAQWIILHINDKASLQSSLENYDVIRTLRLASYGCLVSDVLISQNL